MRPLRLALLASCATFLLLVAGGLVKPTGSSLACPDWPLCNGQAFPAFTGGVQYEHSHRLAALAVTLFSVWLAVAVRRAKDVAPRVKLLSLLLIPMIGLQAALGAITVIRRLPAPVSTAHLGLSMLFFMSVMTCAHWLAQAGSPSRVEPGARRWPAFLALAAVYLQVLLGGFIRHTGAGRACGIEFPTCGGEWWPDLWAARAHQLHRGLGFVVAFVVLAAAIPTARAAARGGRRLARACALVAPFLGAAQVGIGVLTVTSGIRVPVVMAHFILGMGMLACWHAAFVGLGPRRLPAGEPEAAPARSLVEAT